MASKLSACSPIAVIAESYAEDHSLKDWWVAELTSPEAFAESQRRRFRATHGPIL
jgi:hypothetical protein